MPTDFENSCTDPKKTHRVILLFVNSLRLTRRLTRRCFVESEYFRCVTPSAKSLCEKTGERITGWVQMSRDHVFHGGPKYTILSLSGRGMSIVNNPFFDWRYLGPFQSSAPQSGKLTEN